MVSPAQSADIEARWRPLTADETVVAETRLDDAWRLLRRLVPDIESRIGDADTLADAVQALSEAVIRVLRNPDGIRRGTVSIDDASRSFEYGAGSTSADALYFTDEQIAALSLTGEDSGKPRAFSVMPG
jgi:hypothetical protein